jgi:hypothetical protein
MSFIKPVVPERWDRGKWDAAHWDGQLGQTTGTLAVTVTPQTASLVTTHRYTLTGTSLPVTVTPKTASLTVGIVSDAFVLSAIRLPVTVGTSSANLIVGVTQDSIVLTGTTLPLLVTPATANLIVTTAPSGDQVLTATPLSITASFGTASLELEGEVPPLPTLPPPGIIRMGRPAYIPGRW